MNTITLDSRKVRVVKWKTLMFILLVLMPTFYVLGQVAPKSLLQSSHYNMKLGDINIIALSDGSVSQNFNKLLTNVKPNEVEKLTEENFQSPISEVSVNAYLIEINDKLIMVDAGASDLFGPTLGFLPGSLLKAGYKPEQIDAILITHIHTDHTGGLVTNGEITFPNATVYISKKEFDFWMTPENYKNAPESLKRHYENAILKITPLVNAGKIITFDYDEELFPGIMPLPSHGHTPGHTIYRASSQDESVVFWGDILHSAAVQFAKPEVTIEYDVNSKEAAKSRIKAFREAAEKNYWVAADHISFPGIGHVRKTKNGYRWYPINYSTTGKGQ